MRLFTSALVQQRPDAKLDMTTAIAAWKGWLWLIYVTTETAMDWAQLVARRRWVQMAQVRQQQKQRGDATFVKTPTRSKQQRYVGTVLTIWQEFDLEHEHEHCLSCWSRMLGLPCANSHCA